LRQSTESTDRGRYFHASNVIALTSTFLAGDFDDRRRRIAAWQRRGPGL
jgi:hypothetical protein